MHTFNEKYLKWFPFQNNFLVEKLYSKLTLCGAYCRCQNSRVTKLNNYFIELGHFFFKLFLIGFSLLLCFNSQSIFLVALGATLFLQYFLSQFNKKIIILCERKIPIKALFQVFQKQFGIKVHCQKASYTKSYVAKIYTFILQM